MHINFYKKYEEKYVFEGVQREKYNRAIQKWFVVSCFSVFFPLIITLIIDSYDGKFNIVNLINNGDLVLLSFSLTIPTLLDLIEIKNIIRQNNISISLCKVECLFIIIIQVVFYVLIRTHEAKFVTNLISTIIIVPLSIFICRYSIFCIFVSSIEKEGE